MVGLGKDNGDWSCKQVRILVFLLGKSDVVLCFFGYLEEFLKTM